MVDGRGPRVLAHAARRVAGCRSVAGQPVGGLGEAEAIMATMSELWDDYQKDRNKG